MLNIVLAGYLLLVFRGMFLIFQSKNGCSSKDYISELKMLIADKEKAFDKGLLCRLYKELLQLSIKKLAH